jgi:hypothetical protein
VKYPDYQKCQIRTIYLARELEKEGFNPKVLYGVYTPSAPRRLWDERWQKAKGYEFVHFWLGINKRYYDYSCFQFGEREPIKTICTDERYMELGYLDLSVNKLCHTGNMLIEWESLSEKEGVPILNLVPIFV